MFRWSLEALTRVVSAIVNVALQGVQGLTGMVWVLDDLVVARGFNGGTDLRLGVAKSIASPSGVFFSRY